MDDNFGICVDDKATPCPCDVSEKMDRRIFFKIDDKILLELNPDGFFYKGQMVPDPCAVYERFNEWLKKAGG